MGFTLAKSQSARRKTSHEESRDVLGLSMLSLSGFQIYHICDKKLFPYSLITAKKQRKASYVK